MKQSTALVVALVVACLAVGVFVGWKACLILAGGAGAVAASTRRKASESVVEAIKTSERAGVAVEQINSELESADKKDEIERDTNEMERLVMWDSADSGRDRPGIDDS